jgi:hypothetical protein
MRRLGVAIALSLASSGLGACFVDAFGPSGPVGIPCTKPEDCPDDDNPCTRVACTDRLCEFPAVPDGFAAAQVPGDCLSNRCTGGELESEVDDSDTDDGLPCTSDLCEGGMATHSPIAEGDPCELAGVTGTCVDAQCQITCVLAVDCPSDGPCKVSECTSGLCTFTPQSGDPDPPLDDTTPGDCLRPTCVDGEVGSVAQDSDVPPDDGNLCTVEGCDGGVVTVEFEPPGSTCGVGLVCNPMGVCVGCLVDAQCGAPLSCSKPVCSGGQCGVTNEPAGTACVLPSSRDGVCNGAGACVECVDATDCPTAPLCRLATCVASTCGELDLLDGTKCDAGFASDGQCLDGVCVECVVDGDCSGTDECCSNSCGPGPCP